MSKLVNTVYLVGALVATMFSAAMVAVVMNTVILESSSLILDHEIYLARVAERVDWAIPFAILLDCFILFLQYFFFQKSKREVTVKSTPISVTWTYILSFFVWLNYAMYHVLAGQYSLFSVALVVIPPIYLLVWILLFYGRSRTIEGLSERP